MEHSDVPLVREHKVLDLGEQGGVQGGAVTSLPQPLELPPTGDSLIPAHSLAGRCGISCFECTHSEEEIMLQ